jgi:hypothetical protein
MPKRKLVAHWPGDRKNKNLRRSCIQQGLCTSRDRGPGGEDIVNEENSLARDQGWVSYAESVCDSFSPALGVHSSAVAISMRGA